MKDNYRKRYEVYLENQTDILKSLNNFLNSQILGYEGRKSLDTWELFFLTYQMRNDNTINTTIISNKMNCIKNKAICLSVDVEAMDYVFPDTNIKKSLDDGIDFMQIEGDGILHTKFRIF